MDFVSNLFKKTKTKPVAPTIQPEQNNAPNKTVNLLDATTTTFDNSILMPATDPENNTLDVTSTNRENQRPRFSLLGTFDPIFQKQESTDNGKSDSSDVDLRSLINNPVLLIDEQPKNENFNNKSTIDEKKLFTPENEHNKSNVSNVSSISDVSEQNNTVILSKTFAEVKEESGGANIVESVIASVAPIKFVPPVGVSDLSDSFLEKFTKATVISTPPHSSVKNTTPQHVVKEDTAEVSKKFAEEFDIQDTDSIDLENPVSQSEDFDTDSLNEEIESSQNEIFHELSVESSKILNELNKTQETEKEKLQSPVQLEQKEQIIQEINITYSEPISPAKLERQEDIEKEINSLSQEINLSQIEIVKPSTVVISEEQTSASNDTSLLFEKICCEPQSPNKNTSLEISGKFDELDLIPQESDTKITPKKTEYLEEIPVEIITTVTPVKSIENNSFAISTPVAKTAPEVIAEEPINKNISFVIEASSPIAKSQPQSPQKLSEIILNKDITTSPVIVKPEDSAVNKNLSFVIESSPIVKPSSETPEKLSDIILNKEEIIVEPEVSLVNKNISFVIESAPVLETPENEQISSTVDRSISFVIESTPGTPQKLSEIIESSPAVKPEKLPENEQISPAINKNISFVIESSPIVKSSSETPQKLSEVILNKEEITSTPIVKPEDSVVNKNISFVIESSPVPKTPEKLPENEQPPLPINSPIAEKVKPETPQKIETVISEEDLGVKPLEVASDEIIKTPEPIEETLAATPRGVEPVISATSEEIKDKHMSEAKPIEKLEVSESAVTNSVPTNEMGEVINQNDCFQKQSDITNGAFDNKESLDPKNEMYNEMVERLSLLESECEKYKTQIADLKREIKTCRQKSASLESEVADLKRKENELNILLDEYKNKKPEETTDSTDGKDEELKLLRASEESLKNELIDLKVLVKQHENKLKELQQKEVKLADDLSSKTQSELQISRVMEEYEKSISSLVAENEKMKKERDTAQMHLSNIELAFSDVHQKYERCKRVVQGYKDNEDSYRHDIATNRETIATQEQKYATLKSHAMAQLEKSNQELLGIKKQHETEMARLTAQLKRYEIKNDSLMEALQQKTKECEQLSAVCDEFIGNV